MQPINLGIDQKSLGDCLKEVSNIGHTVYVDIYHDTRTIVPWGSMEWLGMIAIASAVIALILFLLYISFHN